MHPQHSWMFYIAILGRYSAFLKEGELLIASAEVVGSLPNSHKQCGVLRRLHIRFQRAKGRVAMRKRRTRGCAFCCRCWRSVALFFLELYVVEGDYEIVFSGVGNVDLRIIFHADEVVGIALAVSDDEGRSATIKVSFAALNRFAIHESVRALGIVVPA